MNDPVPSDLAILSVLRDRAPTPVPARVLAEQHGLTLEGLATRMKSLVSLRYVDCVHGSGDDAYVLGSKSLEGFPFADAGSLGAPGNGLAPPGF